MSNIILGEKEQKPLTSYPQIFLRFLFYFMIVKSWKKIVFLSKPFFAFFIIQVLENSVSYSSLHDRLCLFNGRQMPPVFEVSTFKLILKHVCADNFLWDLQNTWF